MSKGKKVYTWDSTCSKKKERTATGDSRLGKKWKIYEGGEVSLGKEDEIGIQHRGNMSVILREIGVEKDDSEGDSADRANKAPYHNEAPISNRRRNGKRGKDRTTYYEEREVRPFWKKEKKELLCFDFEERGFCAEKGTRDDCSTPNSGDGYSRMWLKVHGRDRPWEGISRGT